MYPLLTDAQFNSVALVLIALIGIIPATMAAVYSRTARSNSAEARVNSAEAKVNSAEAKANSADALHEVKANGGMSDPDPTLKDYIKFVGESVASNTGRIEAIEELLEAHLAHSRIMDSALAQVFLTVRPDLEEPVRKDLEDTLP